MITSACGCWTFLPSTPVSQDCFSGFGLRTAGSYFAPLMTVYLKRLNWSRVSWFSIRPKSGISLWERWQLRWAARRHARVLVVDDYPATGQTLRLTLRILQESKIKPEQ